MATGNDPVLGDSSSDRSCHLTAHRAGDRTRGALRRPRRKLTPAPTPKKPSRRKRSKRPPKNGGKSVNRKKNQRRTSRSRTGRTRTSNKNPLRSRPVSRERRSPPQLRLLRRDRDDPRPRYRHGVRREGSGPGALTTSRRPSQPLALHRRQRALAPQPAIPAGEVPASTADAGLGGRRCAAGSHSGGLVDATLLDASSAPATGTRSASTRRSHLPMRSPAGPSGRRESRIPTALALDRS